VRSDVSTAVLSAADPAQAGTRPAGARTRRCGWSPWLPGTPAGPISSARRGSSWPMS